MTNDPNWPNPNFGADPAIDKTILDPSLLGQPGMAGPAGSNQRTELIGADEAEPIVAWLIFTAHGSRYGDMVRIKGKSFLIGRADDCDLILDDGATSRQHAKIRVEGPPEAPRYMIHDLATDNGTFVNGNRQTPVELQSGDIIRLGRTELSFKRI